MNSNITRVSELVEEDCCMAILVNDMDISLLIMFSQQIEESKHHKEKRRSTMDNEGSNGHGHSKNRQKDFGKDYSNEPKYNMRGC